MNGGWDVGPPIPEAGISRIGRAGKIFEWIGLGSQGRGGSVSLNSLQAVDKWLSALVRPPPGLAWAG